MDEEKKYLNLLTEQVMIFSASMDLVMKEPSDVTRGMKIAKLINALDFTNDSAMHFGLNLTFRQINNRRGKIKKSAPQYLTQTVQPARLT